ISQIPPAAEPPPGCHIPLTTIVAPMPPPLPPPCVDSLPPPPLLCGPGPPPPPPPPPAPVVQVAYRPNRKRNPPSSIEDSIEEIEEERHEIELSEFHFLLANPRVRGYRLKNKKWGTCCQLEFNIILIVTDDFDIDCVHDIHWNPDCFDSLVL